MAAASTLAIAEVPSLRFAYHAPATRIGLETASALIALLAAYLMFGRFLRARGMRSLMLTIALGVLSLTNLLVAVLLAWGPHDTRVLATTGSLAGALLFAVSAYAPRKALRRPGQLRRALAGALWLVAAATGLMVALGAAFPLEAPATVNATAPAVETNAALLTGHLLALAAYVAAAVGFVRRSRVDADSFLPFVAVATVLGAAARLQYLLFGPVQPGLVHTGDVFRVLFYLVLLVGAGREIERYWRGLARAAVLEERQRIARELHDGAAQELAFIQGRARRLLQTGSAEATVREIVASAERGLLDSRRAIAALTRPLDRPLPEVLVEAVEELASRYELEVDVDVEQGVEVTPEAREALVRIAGEAIANAARHGRARSVRVRLAGSRPVRFSVSDDGQGFDPDRPTPGRFGFAMMRERASAVGGSLRVRSAPGHGTAVEVELS